MPTLNPPNSARARIATARARCEQLQGEIRTVRHTKHTGGLPCARSAACRPALCADIEPRRELLGHSNKVLACCWSSDSRRIASTSQDGHLVVWDGVTTAKLDVIKLVSPFTLAVALDDATEYVASGGLDNTVSIHRIRSAHHAPARGFRAPAQTLCAHDGYISCCRYVDRGGTRLLSASGDTSCVLWDTERGADLRRYGREHAGDVLSLAVCPTNESLFVSGSIDLTARLWDLRCAGDRSVMCFDGMHTSDVNSVAFLPGGTAFGTASEDSSCALFDLRSCAQLCRFECAAATSGATSLSFSASGRLAFAGYEDHTVRVWDTLGAAGAAAAAAAAGAAAGHGELGERAAFGSCEPIATLAGHGGQVSAVSVAPDGSAVMTASWDTTLRIWS